AMSLTRYTTPDSAQNTTNAPIASTTAERSKSRRPKSSPAKITRFFVHCPGRSEMRRLRASERPDAASTAEPGAVTGDEVLRAITGSPPRGLCAVGVLARETG